MIEDHQRIKNAVLFRLPLTDDEMERIAPALIIVILVLLVLAAGAGVMVWSTR